MNCPKLDGTAWLQAVLYVRVIVEMRTFRAETVCVVLAAQALSIMACSAETVLCCTREGSVQVETAVNGTCSKQLHNLPGAPRSTSEGSATCLCAGLRRHGPCDDTLLSVRTWATPQQVVVVPLPSSEIEVSLNPADEVVDGRAAGLELIDPPLQQPDLDMIRTVRLLV